MENKLSEEIEEIILKHYNGEKLKEIVSKMDEKIGILVINNIQAKEDILTAVKAYTTWVIGETEPDIFPEHDAMCECRYCIHRETYEGLLEAQRQRAEEGL